ncbi:hypothetical protein GCM10029976_082440 [Kribbella albertanoniae]
MALQRATRTVICPLAIPSLALCAPSGAPPSAPGTALATGRSLVGGGSRRYAGNHRTDPEGSPTLTPGGNPLRDGITTESNQTITARKLVQKSSRSSEEAAETPSRYPSARSALG